MKKYTQTDALAQIISKLPLKERVSFASMKKEDVDTLQHVFDLYIRGKPDHDDGDYAHIMNKLLEHLQ